jgi:hypothetical protein
MKRNRGWLLLALPLALTACGGDDDAENAAETTDTATTTVAPVAADSSASMMGSMPTTLSLQPIGSSNVRGQATLTPSGAQTQVNVQLTGLTPGAHPGHIHEGTCAAPGKVVQPLPEITAGQDGSGTAEGTVAVDAMTVMDGQHIIAYHGEGGAPVVCGELMGHAM